MDKRIELIDENGEVAVFFVVANFRIEGDDYSAYEGNEYAVLAVDESTADEFVLFRVIEENDTSNPLFKLIEDEEEFEMASEFYESIINE